MHFEPTIMKGFQQTNTLEALFGLLWFISIKVETLGILCYFLS